MCQLGISFEHYFKENDGIISPFLGLGPLIAVNSFNSEGFGFNPVGIVDAFPIEKLIREGTNIQGSFIRFGGETNKSNVEVSYGCQGKDVSLLEFDA